jgi:hypothetical protein
MTDSDRPKERRLHPRFSVPGPIEFGVGPEGSASLVDLSRSGLGCVSPKAFEEMSILEIAMQLPVGEDAVDFKAGGAVVRCEPVEGGDNWRVAVFFTHMDDGNRNALDRFLEAQAEA